jgi:hypothetical protein
MNRCELESQLYCFVASIGYSHNIKIKRNKKRRALRGKQKVELLINRVGKRTVVLLNPSFFYFFNPFFVSTHFKNDTGHKQ